jgi:hypothetical protein
MMIVGLGLGLGFDFARSNIEGVGDVAEGDEVGVSRVGVGSGIMRRESIQVGGLF